MSPEQAAGDLDRLGPRSDVYSLGATLYCLLTGKAPFAGDVGEVLRKVQRGDFPPPRQLDPSIDKALEAVCLKAMATNWDGMATRNGEQWYATGCCHAALSGLAGKPGLGVSAGEGDVEAGEAMPALRKAVAMGYRSPETYRTEDELDPLRGREDFKLLIMDLAMPDDPFAR
jgi:serine/threonine protein kinase